MSRSPLTSIHRILRNKGVAKQKSTHRAIHGIHYRKTNKNYQGKRPATARPQLHGLLAPCFLITASPVKLPTHLFLSGAQSPAGQIFFRNCAPGRARINPKFWKVNRSILSYNLTKFHLERSSGSVTKAFRNGLSRWRAWDWNCRSGLWINLWNFLCS